MSSYTLPFQQGQSTRAGSYNTKRNQGSYASSSARPNPRFSQQPANALSNAQPFNMQPSQNNQRIVFTNDSIKSGVKPAAPATQQHQTPPVPANQKKEQKDSDEGINPLGFAFAIMSLVGAPSMLIPAWLGIKKDKQNNLYFKPNIATRKLGEVAFRKKEVTEAEMAILGKRLKLPYNFGKILLATGIIPKTIIGVIYGIQSGQPSMLLAHLCQLPLVKLIWKENKIATTLVYAMGGLFTLGFINDIQNGLIRDGKKPGTKEKIREYDMTHFKKIFTPNSGLSAEQRFTGFFTECAKMLKFSAGDHIVSGKRAISEVGKFIHGEKNDLTDVRSNASISKSSLGFMLSYAATMPALLAAAFIKNDQGKAAKWLSRYSMTTTMLSGLMLNFGMILVALGGKSWAERIPLFGTSMEMGGTVLGYSNNSVIQPIALALQQLGGGFNSIFYAAKAQKD